MTAPTIHQPLEHSEEYPERDGLPMSDNTLQFRWIVTIEGNLEALYLERADVFVAGDLLWYPVEGKPQTRTAPDTMVVFGRPKGDRGSYMQWREGGIAPQVTFEILSPGNRPGEMDRKFEFFDRYGVEEYYLYDPNGIGLAGWIRRDGRLQSIDEMHGWVSPRLGIRFDVSGDELVIFRPDGLRFLTFAELMERQAQVSRLAQEERLAREQAQRRAEQERQAKEDAQRRADRLAEKLRDLGIDPEV
jgi:Uma2 family endonuclease